MRRTAIVWNAQDNSDKVIMVRFLLQLLLLAYFGAFLLAVAGGWVHRHRVLRPPPQPIAFSHTVHAGDLGLACPFCHIHVESSPQAGVPPVEKCMSCHQSVAVDRPEIRKLRRYWEAKAPIPWSRIHSLPEFIHFPHKRHVRAGVDCFACHGAVAKMAEVRKVRPLNMGWCVTCHRSRGAPTDCAVCHT